MADKTELWKPVPGYDGLYEVSNFGGIRSLPHEVQSIHGVRKVRGSIIRQQKNRQTGYLYVCLCKNNIKKTHAVHRIVASAFIQNERNLLQVNHKNENKTDNRAENLEWCSAQYNYNYGTRNKRISEKNKVSKCKPVAQMIGDVVIAIYPSTIAAKHITDPGHIGACANGKRKTAGGFSWRFVKGGEVVV